MPRTTTGATSGSSTERARPVIVELIRSLYRYNDWANGRILEYTNMQGERWAYPLWQQMIHQVNHATQHRSEAAVMLTKLGHSPGWLDLLYFVDLVGGPDMAPHTPQRSSRPGEPGARLDTPQRSSRPGEPGARLDSESK